MLLLDYRDFDRFYLYPFIKPRIEDGIKPLVPPRIGVVASAE
jgi:hypothetical protein